MTQTVSKSKRPAPTRPATEPPASWWKRGWLWGALSVIAAAIPVSGVFSLDRVFFLRDLGLFFWDRHLWLRRSLFRGEWPLWDPSLAAGQSAAADALHQMFLLPVLALRMIGSEVIGFNLWIALPFPLAALGAYVFFRSRFTQPGSALGAITFAVSGPVVSTGNFPNMSWSVAALPWVLWAADRCVAPASSDTAPRTAKARFAGSSKGRGVALLALLFAFQAAAGEPVTLAATAALALALALVVGSPSGPPVSSGRERMQSALGVAVGLALGGCIAAVQLLPMTSAASQSWRAFIRLRDFWSFHPLALVETVAPQLFGDFFKVGTAESVPWVRALNVSREGFFFSVYVGPAVLALAAFGLAAGWRRAWAGFWGTACAIGLIAALGGHTPIYPAARKLLPLVGSFRFPVKYLIVCAIALAALTACGWDAVADEKRRNTAPARYRWGQRAGVLVPGLVALLALLLSAAAMFAATPTARWIFDLANAIGVRNPVDATAFMLRSIADVVPRVLAVSLVVALFVGIAAGRRPEARLARHGLFALLVVDLVYMAWGFNPTCDVRLLAPPKWVDAVRAHPDSRFYFGGKMAGTIEVGDPDAPKGFSFMTNVSALERRVEFVHQIVMFPAGMGAREMLSYDLAILWPRVYETTHIRFVKADAEGRDRFLSRTAVRYRILPDTHGCDRPAVPVERFADMRMFDWGPSITRALVVPEAKVVSDEAAQLEAMFGSDWDASKTAMLMSPAQPPDGAPGSAVEPGARIVQERANQVLVEARAGAGGGYLVLLDSYSPDWHVSVDGQAGHVYRSNLLFRAVRLTPGRHQVEFTYRPHMLLYGAGLSVVGLVAAAFVAFRARGDSK
jgi:hypothetical protein